MHTGRCQRRSGLTPGILRSQTDAQTIKDFGTARLRFGWDRTLGDLPWYVTGGAAWGRIEDLDHRLRDASRVRRSYDRRTSRRSPGSFSHFRFGWTVGAGAELPLWDRRSVKGEYLFVDLGSVSDLRSRAALDAAQLPATTITTGTSFHVYDHIVRLGLNYHFN